LIDSDLCDFVSKGTAVYIHGSAFIFSQQ